MVGVGWLRWLVGGSGWVMASVGLAMAILTGALWLLSLQDASVPRIDWLVGLLAAACAIYGLIAGAFLDGPRRGHWKGGISQPRRGVPETRATPARFSPPVQKVVDERLTNVRLPQVSLPSAARLKAVGIPRPTRPAIPLDGSRDGLTIAEDITPHPPPGTQAVPSTAEVAGAMPVSAEPAIAVDQRTTAEPPPPTELTPPVEPASAVERAVAVEPASAVERAVAVEPAPAPLPSSIPATTSTEATEVVAATSAEERTPSDAAPAPTTDAADPNAPTQPIAAPATEWPKPIEPRTRTGAHKVDPDA